VDVLSALPEGSAALIQKPMGRDLDEATRILKLTQERNLIAAVYAAGGEPLLVHPVAPDGVVTDDEVAARLRWADGILLPGGGDLAAQWSGQPDHPTLYDVDLEQDAFDLAAARVALAAGVPVLAVCRGTQVVNVVRGGTLAEIGQFHTGDEVAQRRAAFLRQTGVAQNLAARERVRELLVKPHPDGGQPLEQKDMHGFDKASLGSQLIGGPERRRGRAGFAVTKARLGCCPIIALC